MKSNYEEIYCIDYYSYISKIRTWNSTFKVLLSFITLLLCIILNNIYVSLIILFTMSFVTAYWGKLNLCHYISLLTIPFIFIITGSITIGIDVSLKPCGQHSINLYWFYLYTSDKNIFKALQIIFKSLGAVSSMYMMILSTPASEIISVLQKLHVPKIITELMNMTYRFIFILMDVQCKMKNSAKSRLGYCDFKTSCYSFGHIAGNLLLISLKKSNTYYDALISRCYNGNLIFLEYDKKVKPIHIIMSSIYFFILIIVWIITK